MTHLRRLVLVTLVAALICSIGSAQSDGFERVDVTVTSVVGRGVYLDKGREAGIARGDIVHLNLLDGTLVIATVRAVSRTGSRAEPRDGPVLVDVGTRGQVLVPATRGQAPDEAPQSVDPPPAASSPSARPPTWESPPEEWDESVPLLAPITARTPEERDRRVSGRIFTELNYIDDSGDIDRRYFSSFTGLDFRLDNPFGRAGAFDFQGAYNHRSADLEDEGDASETIFLLRRASYRWGGIRGKRSGFEVGRFLQNEMPELGVVDGIEYGYRFDSGSRIGASIGFMPEPTDEMMSGDDFQVAAFYRFMSDERETFSLGTGVQKTWHEGQADRDLVLASVRFTPSRRWSAFATAWVDFYTASDEIKDEGFELTQLQFNGSYRSDEWGFGLFGSKVRLPELLRTEFPETSAEEIAKSDVQRLGLNGWYRPTPRTRIDARADAWEDEGDSGGSADLRYALTDIIYDGGEVAVGVFGTRGRFSSGLGARASATYTTGRGFFRASYDLTNFEQEDFNGSQEQILHHSVRLSYDLTLGTNWDLSLYARNQQREDLNAISAGLTLQRRF